MLRPWCATVRALSGSRSFTFYAAVLGLIASSFLIPASAQESRRPAPGTLIIPSSNYLSAEDTGVRAHTNIRLLVPPELSPSELPPFAGFGFETPASMACIYRLVQPVRGCNPNSTTNTPHGGSQSIAIVDAFDDPDAAADLAHFSSQFGLPFDAAKFKVVYAQGTKPPTDPSGGWELEEAADIEWAHAMAPNAMLYLVEAKSDYGTDMYPAVLVAANLVRCGKTSNCPANASGKGEVSMSWGTAEYPTENSDDSIFTGKNLVFLAATGDATGVIYPSASPNVIGVGGTSTARSLYTGNLIQEIAWSDAGGGLSAYEVTPPYQSALPAYLTQGARALPDVSANANPNNGYWEYDSYPIPGVSNSSNWWVVGGTSLSTPVWAGIINAASTASGHFAASSKEELTTMYANYANSTTYHADFWDITYGACNFYSGSFSVGGYDLCTGLGSPKGLGGK